MIPRGTPDLGWSDLVAGLVSGLSLVAARRAAAAVEAAWTADPDALVCLSVRSAFDLLLQVLALPPGSEVLVSAVTIPDMPAILRHHGLVPVPVDIDPATLGVDAGQIRALIGPTTRAILVAHLFGSRMPLDAVAAVARQHGLLLIEDCAQAYDASSFRGHPEADVSLFSWGPIKLATALGGALVRVRDPALRAEMRKRHAQYPRQARSVFVRRVSRFALLKALARPWLFGWLVLWCRLRGGDHDRLINAAVRSFAGPDLIQRLRHQPSVPLLRLLHRRLRHADGGRIERRAQALGRIVAAMPTIGRPGAAAEPHRHWVLPITSADPETLVRLLWAHGFDATRKASSLIVVPSCPHRSDCATPRAQQMLDHLVYLPASPVLRERQVAQLAAIVTDFERRRTQRPEHR